MKKPCPWLLLNSIRMDWDYALDLLRMGNGFGFSFDVEQGYGFSFSGRHYFLRTFYWFPIPNFAHVLKLSKNHLSV